MARLKVPSRLEGVKVLIADYQDEDTLRFLKAEEPELTLQSQRLINQAFAREMRKRGARVQDVPVKIDDYFAWLGKHELNNTPANRAQFIGWLTASDPKPTPLKD